MVVRFSSSYNNTISHNVSGSTRIKEMAIATASWAYVPLGRIHLGTTLFEKEWNNVNNKNDEYGMYVDD